MSSVVRASRIGTITLLLGLSALSIQPAQAETTEQQAPLSTITPEVNSDPFSSRGDNNGAIMQLIHRAMRGEANVDRAAQSAEQRENLSEAANDFFAKRNQRLKKNPATPIVAPSGLNQPGSLQPGMIAPIAPIVPIVQPSLIIIPVNGAAEPPAPQPVTP